MEDDSVISPFLKLFTASKDSPFPSSILRNDATVAEASPMLQLCLPLRVRARAFVFIRVFVFLGIMVAVAFSNAFRNEFSHMAVVQVSLLLPPPIIAVSSSQSHRGASIDPKVKMLDNRGPFCCGVTSLSSSMSLQYCTTTAPGSDSSPNSFFVSFS